MLIHQPCVCSSSNLRSLLALRDGNATRAFADAPYHRDLFDTHQLLVADGLWLSASSIGAVKSFLAALPPHLMSDGVLYDAPFATMTVKDAFECDGTAETVSLTVTDRSFNVFQNQLGDATEDAFGSTDFPCASAGLYLSVRSRLLSRSLASGSSRLLD